MNYSLHKSDQKQLLPLQKNWTVAELQVSYKQKNRTGVLVKSTNMAYSVLRHMWDKSLINIQEQFCVLFLNHNLEVLGFRVISTGCLTSSIVDVNLILSCAMLSRSTGVIVAHNHPSGNLQYSKGDFVLTLQIRNNLKQFNIQLLDHLIITDSDYFSFSDNGVIFQ
jgi:DNA repair protein RadC